jgi:hypothetical protein
MALTSLRRLHHSNSSRISCQPPAVMLIAHAMIVLRCEFWNDDLPGVSTILLVIRWRSVGIMNRGDNPRKHA